MSEAPPPNQWRQTRPGILRGFGRFSNPVIDECVETATSGEQSNIGTVVIPGSSTVILEALERV
ncbi:unnamed protein product [Nyctereutes procyonoides]|uniref:(raccoon dog) hypothetical protein n=1 Tax=Nyctereutes procyonoides TaxID=34880 RepID=A0A811ZZB0_NYCPR|nr:unnamed protein product [Nyctereutes procyonoides]